MRKRTYFILILAAIALLLTAGACLQNDQQRLSGKLIRLHVVANSDSKTDQSIKLAVRDAVLQQTSTILDGADDPEAVLCDNLPMLQTAAETTLRALDCPLPVSVSMGNERFPTRDYDTFRLPGGVYRTLRVTIGEGAGHNWWCVVYPSLCLTASMDDLELAAETAGFTHSELRLITGAGEGYELKFKTMEWLEKLKAFFADI